MVPFDGPHTSSCLSAVVNRCLSCTVTEIFSVEYQRDLELLLPVCTNIMVHNTVARRQFVSSSSRMRVMNHNWSATKQRLHPQSVAEISRQGRFQGGAVPLWPPKKFKIRPSLVKIFRKLALH